MVTIKITFTDGVVDAYDFANVVKKALQKEEFEFINNGYNPMHDRITYRIEKDNIVIGELGLPRTLTQQETISTLRRIKEIKDTCTPRVEELEFDL